MSEEQSQKQGLRSASSKEQRARDAYASIAPSNRAGRAFGKEMDECPFEEELSMSYEERLAEKREKRNVNGHRE